MKYVNGIGGGSRGPTLAAAPCRRLYLLDDGVGSVVPEAYVTAAEVVIFVPLGSVPAAPLVLRAVQIYLAVRRELHANVFGVPTWTM